MGKFSIVRSTCLVASSAPLYCGACPGAGRGWLCNLTCERHTNMDTVDLWQKLRSPVKSLTFSYKAEGRLQALAGMKGKDIP